MNDAACPREGEEMNDAIVSDRLTGLSDRRLAIWALQRCRARARSDTVPYGILLIDVDHLKEVNRTLGRETGDLVLKTIARELLERHAAPDLVVRWADDRFLVVLASDAVGSVRGAADEVAAAVDVCPVPVRCSAGAALARPDEDVPDVLDRAEALLTAGKRTGGAVAVDALIAVPA
jgi:diguanylate cyclase (GGDEF)-like protein